MIHRVVDAEEAVVGALERINGNGTVLCILALQVERQLAGDAARIDLCAHTVTFVQKNGLYGYYFVKKVCEWLLFWLEFGGLHCFENFLIEFDGF